MLIQGKWYDKGGAAQVPAVLHLVGERYKLDIEGRASIFVDLEYIKVSDRLGNVERKLTFQDGSVFATHDNDAVDKLFNSRSKISNLIHVFESHLGLVAVALILTIISSISFFKWGIPWISTKIAHALPQETNEFIAANTLEFLDDYIFEESKLDSETMENIREHFKSKVIPLEENHVSINYTLHFRDWSEGEFGIPNALALPSGDIVLTDEFVRLCETQDEMDSVLLHEMGHVVHRHSLEMVIEATLITTAIMLVTGDNNGIADLGIGLGSLLVSTHYSRNHETEADKYAFGLMLKAKIDPNSFSSILSRITKSIDGMGSVDEEEIDPKNNDDNGLWDYLSTHPSTEARVKQAEIYSKCFQAGLEVCDFE